MASVPTVLFAAQISKNTHKKLRHLLRFARSRKYGKCAALIRPACSAAAC